MTTIKVFAVIVATLLAYLVSWLTGSDAKDIMIIVSFIGTINLLTSRWIGLAYMREVMKAKDKQ